MLLTTGLRRVVINGASRGRAVVRLHDALITTARCSASLGHARGQGRELTSITGGPRTLRGVAVRALAIGNVPTSGRTRTKNLVALGRILGHVEQWVHSRHYLALENFSPSRPGQGT